MLEEIHSTDDWKYIAQTTTYREQSFVFWEEGFSSSCIEARALLI
jgi:hypothetical protein